MNSIQLWISDTRRKPVNALHTRFPSHLTHDIRYRHLDSSTPKAILHADLGRWMAEICFDKLWEVSMPDSVSISCTGGARDLIHEHDLRIVVA